MVKKIARKKGKKSLGKRVLKRKAIKKSTKKIVKKKVQKVLPAKKIISKEELVGLVTHFYDKISVAVVKIVRDVKAGEMVEIRGKNRSFVQKIGSMQIDHEQITTAKKGQIIGMKVIQPVKQKDLVYRKL